MQYFGGKQRIAKNLVEIIGPVAKSRGVYVEPFVGSAAVMSVIEAPIRIGADSNIALITLWRALSNGWEPPQAVSENMYADTKNRNDSFDPLTAFIGFGCSFAGKWFGGYARNGENRNYAVSATNSLRKKMFGLSGVSWIACDYESCPTPDRCVIYCDPPYQGTTQYGGAPEPFNWNRFWNFCRQKSREGHIVFVSEYAGPSDFICVAEIQTKLDIRDANGARPPRIEKLFTNMDWL